MAKNIAGITLVHEHHATLGSTFDRVPDCISKIKNDVWYLITSDEQTAGQATHKKTWASPAGINIYATFVFPIPIDQKKILANIPQVTAYAVILTLKQFGLQGKLKWVNDVRINGKKIGGILCKSEICGESLSVSTGIGINVNMTKEACAALDQPVTSCAVEANREFDRKAVLEALKEHFITSMKLLITRGFKPFSRSILDLMEFMGQTIRVKEDVSNTILKGIMIGLNEDGMLQLQTAQGIQTLLTGHIMLEEKLPQN